MRSLFLLLAILSLLASCRTLVQDEFPDFEQKPSLNALFSAGDTLKVHVSLASKLDSTRLTVVENAAVDLYVDQVFKEQFTYTQNGIYASTVIAEPQKEYSCKVNVPGFEAIECSQVLPSKPNIISIEHINIAGKDEEGTSYPAIKLTFENSFEREAFYEIEIRNIRRFGDEVYIGIPDIHFIVDPVILNEGMPIALFSNDLITDSLYTMLLNYTTHSASSRDNGPWRTEIYPFVVELRQVTEDYYRFKKQLHLYEQGRFADGIITSITNTNLYSNIENGYGIFAGYSSFVSDTITPNTDGYYY